jgi:hypothetical protein
MEPQNRCYTEKENFMDYDKIDYGKLNAGIPREYWITRPTEGEQSEDKYHNTWTFHNGHWVQEPFDYTPVFVFSGALILFIIGVLLLIKFAKYAKSLRDANQKQI